MMYIYSYIYIYFIVITYSILRGQYQEFEYYKMNRRMRNNKR